jgi:hypothetical protein
MGSWVRRFGPGLTAALVLAGPLLVYDLPMARGTAGQTPAAAGAVATQPPSDAQIAAWVRELGSPSFAVRQRATRELIDSGIAAREALEKAGNDPDAEVRMRARSILAVVFESDFRDRLEAFSADNDGRHKKTLPGWEQFVTHFGSGGLARQMFVDMQRAEPELLEALTKGGKPASDALEERCQNVIQQAMQNPSGGRLSLGSVASLLLVGASENVSVDEQLGVQFYPWLIYQPVFQRVFQKNSQNGDWAPMLRKLLGLWVAKDGSPTVVAENLKFAAMFELKDEALTIATRVLADEHSPATTRQPAILLVGKFGRKEHLPILEKLLADESSCGAFQAAGNPPRQVELQVRDIALAVLVQLTGQNMGDYGYVAAQPHPTTVFQINTLIFAQPAQRDTALKKWARWRMEHPGS